jgi:DNA polymerase
LDVILTRSIFDALRPQFGTEELKLIDLTTRLFTEPILELDAPLLQEYRDEIVAHKGFLLLQAGVVKETLMSNDKFAEELRRRGVEPEMKDSPTAKDEFGRPKRTYAFAKTDSFMKSLLEHEDDVVRTLAEARLGVKTSIAETRAERYIDMASRGPAPIYLKYWGAEQTGRHSAGDKSNFLNLGRNKRLEKFHLAPGHVIVAPTGRTQILKVSKDGKRLLTVRGEEWKVKECHRIGLRDSIRAPKGYMLIAGDSSNIEARMLCYLAGQKDILEVYRAGGDPYCSLASHIFHREITKEDEEERFFGKIGVLGCGYQMGPSKLREAARAMYDIDMDIEMARTVVYTFRETYDQVTRWWKYLLEVVIPAMADGRTVYADPNGLAITGKHMITTGGGRVLRYPNLRQVRRNDDQGGTEWVFDVRDGVRSIPAKLYGGKLAEELTQHFARNVVMAQALKVNKKYRVVHMVYDEIVCCVPEDEAEECEQYVQKVMSTAPSWAPTLPVAAETGKGVIYGCC